MGHRLRQVVEVFRVALRLGLISFGGPIAPSVRFRREYVEHRGWLDDAAFSELAALVTGALVGPLVLLLG